MCFFITFLSSPEPSVLFCQNSHCVVSWLDGTHPAWLLPPSSVTSVEPGTQMPPIQMTGSFTFLGPLTYPVYNCFLIVVVLFVFCQLWTLCFVSVYLRMATIDLYVVAWEPLTGVCALQTAHSPFPAKRKMGGERTREGHQNGTMDELYQHFIMEMASLAKSLGRSISSPVNAIHRGICQHGRHLHFAYSLTCVRVLTL